MATYKRERASVGKDHPMRALYPDGRTLRSRVVLWEKLEGKNAPCHWCGETVRWEDGTLCADHLQAPRTDDRPENLVPSCRGCNSNRGDGTGHGRRPVVKCPTCGKDFLRNRITSTYCSIACIARPPRGSKAEHGTRSRYQFGCRCDLCRAENTRAWRDWRQSKECV